MNIQPAPITEGPARHETLHRLLLVSGYSKSAVTNTMRAFDVKTGKRLLLQTPAFLCCIGEK